jgi:hypothetical protein
MTGTIASQSVENSGPDTVNPRFDWKRIAYLLLASRGLDDTEEQKLLPEKKVVYQFSARAMISHRSSSAPFSTDNTMRPAPITGPGRFC